MTFEQFNTASPEAARAALLRCCGSQKWSEGVLARRPFRSREELLAAGESVWWTLSPSDWLEAFSAHPRIGENKNGDRKISTWSSEEQSGVDHARSEIVERLAQGNKDYETRFGRVFLVNATGKSAPEMLHVLETRLKNESTEEMRITAVEQASITKLRLSKLLDE